MNFNNIKLPINKTKNKVTTMLKYLSIKLFIKFPNNFNKPAKIKNRKPRANNALLINNDKLRLNRPLAIVINLKGKGVKPAPNTNQTPLLTYIVSKLKNWSSNP